MNEADCGSVEKTGLVTGVDQQFFQFLPKIRLVETKARKKTAPLGGR